MIHSVVRTDCKALATKSGPAFSRIKDENKDSTYPHPGGFCLSNRCLSRFHPEFTPKSPAEHLLQRHSEILIVHENSHPRGDRCGLQQPTRTCRLWRKLRTGMKPLRAHFPDARIIILTTFGCDGEIQRALAAGAQSYLVKTMPPQEMIEVIRRVHAGRKFIPPEVAAHLAEHLGDEPLT